MATILITGAARGIGFQLAKGYAAAGDRVLATCRSPARAEALNALARASDDRLTVHAMDVGSSASVHDCAREIGDQPIDVLINNAGVWGGLDTQVFANMDYDNWMHELNIMAMGPFRVIQAFMPNVRRGQQKKIVTISSQTGAHAYDHVIGYSYASAKAAVNRLMTGLATEFRDEGITIVPLHPGWVKTDMAGDVADISPEESATGVLRTIAGMTIADTGKFLKWTGDVHPW